MIDAPQALLTESLRRRDGLDGQRIHVGEGGQDVHRRRAAAAQKGEERREMKQPGNNKPGQQPETTTQTQTQTHTFSALRA